MGLKNFGGKSSFSDAKSRNDERDNKLKFDISKDKSISRDLGAGDDRVEIKADTAVTNIRVTFTSADVGNANPLDGNNAFNEDGGLAVRVQAEDASGNLIGLVSRFDDEGITFETKGDAKFDVRDLPTGTQRGNSFDVVALGTSGNDTFDESGESEAYYINAGGGDDIIIGGLANDFLVGGAGNDRIEGREGDDSLLGGGGSDLFVFTGTNATSGLDRILDFTTGVDKIDLSAYGITADNIKSTTRQASTFLLIDTDQDGVSDLNIVIVGAPAPASFDYIL